MAFGEYIAAGEAVFVTADSARLEGFVTDAETGAGLDGIEVQLSSADLPVALAMTDETGAFEFTGLEAGLYTVSAAGAESAALDVSLGQTISDLVLDVEPDPAATGARPPTRVGPLGPPRTAR